MSVASARTDLVRFMVLLIDARVSWRVKQDFVLWEDWMTKKCCTKHDVILINFVFSSFFRVLGKRIKVGETFSDTHPFWQPSFCFTSVGLIKIGNSRTEKQNWAQTYGKHNDIIILYAKMVSGSWWREAMVVRIILSVFFKSSKIGWCCLFSSFGRCN